MDGFKHGAIIANVGAGNYAQAAYEAGGEVTHHVAIEIGQQKHVKLQRVHHHLHAGVVND